MHTSRAFVLVVPYSCRTSVVTLRLAAPTMASCTTYTMRVIWSYCNTSDHDNSAWGPKLPLPMSRTLIPRPKAPTQVPSIASMMSVFHILLFIFGVLVPVPFSWTWLEWI